MSTSVYFMQECPTCGRNIQVAVKFLGRKLVCQHCGAVFEACDPTSATYPPGNSGIALLDRASQLLESTDVYRARPR